MKYKEIVEKMTLEEKAAILSGKTVWQTREFPRLDLPMISLSDGPHGVRKQAGEGDHLGLNVSLKATCFPTAATIANSWNMELGEELGKALGEEAVSMDVQVLLGPGLNIKRSPLCGRNFEYFSEDPYLSGKMAASYVRGIQSQGIYACPKHFAVNSQELRRMSMDAVVDERALREIYLTGFEIAIKEGNAKAIMSAYNQINGVYANENKKLLLDILREEWGFDGIVVTDWGGSNDHVEGVKCRSNLEMPAPGLDSARQIVQAVEDGYLKEEELNQCVEDLVKAIWELKDNKKSSKYHFNDEKHHELAKIAAVESTVLLKNEDCILPLPEKSKVALIGDFAFVPRYQGAGSSMVNPTKVECIADTIKDYDLEVVGMAMNHETAAAVEYAKSAEYVIFCFGLDEISESEGMDRTHMRLPKPQIDLLNEIYKVNKNIIGILSGGSAIEMPWLDWCKAILHGYLNGQAGSSAMLDLLTGKENPSGKLSETYPLTYMDTPAYNYYPSKERTSEYRESIYVGYRYYDTAKIPVKYPFGYGLSYTEFSYSDLKIDKTGASFVITNNGKLAGAEIAQLYVGLDNAKVFRAKKELKGFRKVYLEAGESKKVHISFDDKTFRYWNVKTNAWEIETGCYQIMVGSSSADIHLFGELEIQGTTNVLPYEKNIIPAYESAMIGQVDNLQFETILGKKIPDGSWSGELGLNDAICQMYYAKSRIARFIYRRLDSFRKQSEDKGKPDLNILFIYNMPFRGIAKMTNGMVSMEMAEGIVEVVNGHFFKGLGKVIAGFFKNRSSNRKYEKMLKEIN